MGYGFFNTNEYQKKDVVKFSASCGSCGFSKKCKSPKMPVAGKGQKGIFILLEHPTKKQDYRGNMFCGRSMLYLKKVLARHNVDIKRDCFVYSAINCAPSADGVLDKYVQHCRPNVIKQIKKLNPSLVICLGSSALKSLASHRYHGHLKGIEKWRGFTFPDHEHDCWLSFSYGPAFVRQHKQKGVADLVFDKDIKNALQYANIEMPEEENLEEKIICVTDPKEINHILKTTNETCPPIAAFDYETTGLKPQQKGHEIVSCAICHDPDICYSFPMLKEIKEEFCRFLANKAIAKVAANMKFEEIWGRVVLDERTENWIWDTMIAAHCLDNRPGISSLKYQALVHWGVWDYDSHISPYLRAEEDHGNAFNKIHQIPVPDLLLYNGIDSLLELRLAFVQMMRMGIIDIGRYVKTRRVPDVAGLHEKEDAYVQKMTKKQRLATKTKKKARY